MWQGRGHIPLGFWMVSPLWPRLGPRAANRTLSRGHSSIRPLSRRRSRESKGNKFNPSRAGSQRSRRAAGGERVCIINQRHSCLYPCISMTLARCCQSHLHGFPRTKDSRPNHTQGQNGQTVVRDATTSLPAVQCCSRSSII